VLPDNCLAIIVHANPLLSYSDAATQSLHPACAQPNRSSPLVEQYDTISITTPPFSDLDFEITLSDMEVSYAFELRYRFF
jgi:hypothetical protein